MNRTRSFTSGAALLGIASLIDVVGVFTTDGDHPPMSVAMLATVLGVISLILLGLAWRGSRAALGVAVGLRLLSTASALPAFFVGAVPALVVVLVLVIILLNVVGVALVWPALRRAHAAT